MANIHEIKEQRFEAFRCPIFDTITLGGRQVSDCLVSLNLAKLVMERLVGHHQLYQAAEDRIPAVFVQIGERSHRQPFEQHLHADKLLIGNRGFEQILEQITE